jgi:transcriptional regulator with XRE-family HTH domain
MSKIKIGPEIKKIVKSRGYTVEDLAKALNVSKPNIFNIYKRDTIDTGLLERLCKVLNHNFFQQYNSLYQTEPDKDLLKLYKEKNQLLMDLIREKEEVYQLTLNKLAKKTGKK